MVTPLRALYSHSCTDQGTLPAHLTMCPSHTDQETPPAHLMMCPLHAHQEVGQMKPSKQFLNE